MKKHLLWSFILLLLVAGCQMQPKDTPVIADYMPSTEYGYQFQGSGNEYASYTFIPEYSSDGSLQFRKLTGATEIVEVYQFAERKWTQTYEQAETYYRDDLRAFKSLPKEVLLMEPLKVGTSWKLSDGSVRTITNMGFPITIMKEQYSALEVTTTDTMGEWKQYYVKGKGLVKVTYADGISSTLEQLISPALTKQVRLFFPDPRQKQYSYIETSITFQVNDQTEKKLEEAYRNAIQTYLPTLTLATTINQISLQDNIATIDVSSDFMDDLELVAGQEDRIATALMMTFAYYYQTSKALLSVDGVPYQSALLPLPSAGYHNIDVFDAAPWSE